MLQIFTRNGIRLFQVYQGSTLILETTDEAEARRRQELVVEDAENEVRFHKAARDAQADWAEAEKVQLYGVRHPDYVDYSDTYENSK